MAPAGTRGECQKGSRASSRCRSRWTWGPLKSARKGVGTPSSRDFASPACTGGFRDDSDPPFLLAGEEIDYEERQGIGLTDVQAVYSGPEGRLWELIMGEQIHIGGFSSSMDLAEQAGIASGTNGVDLCCCNGAGMRFLVRFRDVARMHGVDATETVVERGQAAMQAGGTGRPDPVHPGRRVRQRLAERTARISSGARTPGATWWTRTS